MNLDELDDLARRAAATVNAIAAIADDDRSDVPFADPTRRRRHRRVVAAAVGAVAAVVVAATGWVVTRGGDDQVQTVDEPPATVSTTAAPPPTAAAQTAVSTTAATPPTTGDWDWLTEAFGAATTDQDVPSGWEVGEVSGLRFATPPGWSAPAFSCDLNGAPGAVFANQATDEADCSRSGAIESITIIDALDDVPADFASTYGQIELESLRRETCGPNCSGWFRGPSFSVRVTGERYGQLLATFAEPGWRQALRTGPVADRSGWQDVTVGGVTLSVPPAWPVHDLAGSVTVTTDALGAPIAYEGRTDPGTCGNGLFAGGPSVSLGTSPLQPSCAPTFNYDLSPVDGVWARPAATTDRQGDELGEALAAGQVAGLDITVHPGDSETRAGVIELVVRGGNEPLRISIGVGTDVTTARAVLTSLRLGPTAPVAPPTTAPRPTLTLRGDGLGSVRFGDPMDVVLAVVADAKGVEPSPVFTPAGCITTAGSAINVGDLALGFSDSGDGLVFSSWSTSASDPDVLRAEASWEDLDPVAGTPHRGVGRFDDGGPIYLIEFGDEAQPGTLLSAGPDCDRLHPPFLEAGPNPVGLTYRARLEPAGYTAIVRTDRGIATEYTAGELVGDIQHVVAALDGPSSLWSTRSVDVDGEPAREVLAVFDPPPDSFFVPLPDECGNGFLMTLPDGSTRSVTADPATGEFVVTPGSC